MPDHLQGSDIESETAKEIAKETDTEIDKRTLRSRLIRSIAVGVLFVSVVAATFLGIRYGTQSALLPTPLRTVSEINHNVGKTLFSAQNLAPLKPAPPVGKKPRVNGLLGLKSEINPETFRVFVESGEKRLELKVAEIEALEATSMSVDFKCIEGWTQVMQYGGVKFTEFMKKFDVGRKPDGSLYRYVGLETPDRGYYVSLDIESMQHPQTLLAFEMNGEILRPENGFPLRLIVPHKYGIKSLKRVGRIFFSDMRPPDYWAERGYDWYSGL